MGRWRRRTRNGEDDGDDESEGESERKREECSIRVHFTSAGCPWPEPGLVIAFGFR
jgi:hypothetical protein